MSEGSTVLLPLLFAFIVLVPCLFSFDAFVVDGLSLLALPLVVNGVTKNSDTTKGILPLVAYNSRNFSSSIDVNRGAELIKSLLSYAEKLYINIGDNSMLDAFAVYGFSLLTLSLFATTGRTSNIKMSFAFCYAPRPRHVFLYFCRTYSTNSSVLPIVKYANADIEKLEILKDNKGKAGVYR
jgi:hypothetical protein